MNKPFETPKRWYDRQPKLAQAVRLMFLFPNEVKSIISEGIMMLANREFAVNEKMSAFKTLGAEKVLGIYKSKNKRREYDRNLELHKAMNYLYILSNENQDFMADHILRLVGHIQDYLSACQAFKAEPTTEDVAQITEVYVSRGTEEVRVFLDRIRYEFHQKLLAGGKAFQPVDFLENISLDEQALGLRLKKSE